jgi:hypothetical protein
MWALWWWTCKGEPWPDEPKHFICEAVAREQVLWSFRLGSAQWVYGVMLQAPSSEVVRHEDLFMHGCCNTPCYGFTNYILITFISSEKSSDQYLGLICDESLTCWGLNLNLGQFGDSTLLSLFVWRIAFVCLMVCRYMCNMAGSNEDRGMSRRPNADDQWWSSIGRVLSGQAIRRSGDVVCGLYCAQGDEERVFLDLASKPRSTVSRFEP